jgi:hypothetical protein
MIILQFYKVCWKPKDYENKRKIGRNVFVNIESRVLWIGDFSKDDNQHQKEN